MSLTLDQVIMQDMIAEGEEEQEIMFGKRVVSPKAKKIIFNYDLDQTLLLETTTINPFKDNGKWAEVSKNVTEHYRAVSKDGDFLLSSRACKDRVILLINTMNKNTETSEKTLKR